jgi:hypothetical protein
VKLATYDDAGRAVQRWFAAQEEAEVMHGCNGSGRVVRNVSDLIAMYNEKHTMSLIRLDKS